MSVDLQGDLAGAGKTFCIVVSRFNDFICSHLLSAARDVLVRHGVSDDDIDVVRVPGAFEIPAVARKVAATRKHAAVICLGAVIRGETPHFDYVASEAAKGVAAVGFESDMPVAFGILTTDTLEQAINRAGAKSGNKGAETAMAALEMADLYDKLRSMT